MFGLKLCVKQNLKIILFSSFVLGSAWLDRARTVLVSKDMSVSLYFSPSFLVLVLVAVVRVNRRSLWRAVAAPCEACVNKTACRVCVQERPSLFTKKARQVLVQVQASVNLNYSEGPG